MSEISASGEIQALSPSTGSRLKGIGTSLGKFLFFSLADERIYPRKGIALSIDKGRLSIAYGSRFLSGISIKASKDYVFEGDKYPQPKDVASSLSLFIKEYRLKQTEVTISVPKAWTIIKTAEFPSTILENVSEVISYEMDRITPFTADGALYDFRILQDGGKKLTLLVTAARADLIQPYMDALAESGRPVQRITVNTSAIGTLCRYVERKSDAVFLDIGEEEFEATLFVRGTISRSLSNRFPGSDDISVADAIAQDASMLLESAKEQGSRPTVFALFRRGRPAVREALRARLQAPVSAINESAVGSRFPVSSSDMPYAAIGSVLEALWPDSMGMNLLTRGVREKQKRPFLLTGLLLSAILILAILYTVAPLRFEEKRLRELTAQIEAKKEEARKVEALKKETDTLQAEVATITGFRQGRTMDLQIFKELTATLPDSVWLSRVKITETGVDIEGYAKSASELLPKIEASRLFRKAEFASSTVRDTRTNADRFVIRMEIEGALPIQGEKEKHEKK